MLTNSKYIEILALANEVVEAARVLRDAGMIKVDTPLDRNRFNSFQDALATYDMLVKDLKNEL